MPGGRRATSTIRDRRAAVLAGGQAWLPEGVECPRATSAARVGTSGPRRYAGPGTAEPVATVPRRPCPPRRRWFQIDGDRRGAGFQNETRSSAPRPVRRPRRAEPPRPRGVDRWPSSRRPEAPRSAPRRPIRAWWRAPRRQCVGGTAPPSHRSRHGPPIGPPRSRFRNIFNRGFATNVQLRARESLRGGDRDACFSRSEYAPHVNAWHDALLRQIHATWVDTENAPTPATKRPPGRAPAGRRRAASEGQVQGPSAVSGASTTPSGRV